MNPLTVMLTAAIGYLMGAVSFARLVTTWVSPGGDITDLHVPIVGRNETSKVEIVGANAASMILGSRFGCAIGLMDMLKVALPMLGLRLRYPGQPYSLIMAVAGLVGHNWPIYYRFKGGRGFSVIFGSFLVTDWLGALVTTVVGMLLGMVVAGNAALAYVSWLWLMIPWMWFRSHGTAYLAYAIIVNLLFAVAAIPEIKAFIIYRREGKLDGYMEGLMASSPRWRGMRKMADRLSLLRRR